MNGISFVMPAFNCESTIKEAVESIYDSNFEQGDEVIIIDDASTDATIEVIRSLRGMYPSVKVLRHNYNKGSAAAGRNTGIDAAVNDLIFCLDADNILEPGSVHKLRKYMSDNKADAASFGEIRFFIESREKVTHSWIFKSGLFSLQDALSQVKWPGPSGNYMFTRQSWIEACRQHEFVGGGIDSWAFGIRQLATGALMVIMPGTGYFHRYGYESTWVKNLKNNTSIQALQVLMPFLHMIREEDVEYLFSAKGRYTWFDHIGEKPVRLKATACRPNLLSKLFDSIKIAH